MGWRLPTNCLAGPSGSSGLPLPLALIVAPTRELALQVHRELAWLVDTPRSARVVSCVGGMDPRREQRELAAGARIVVARRGAVQII